MSERVDISNAREDDFVPLNQSLNGDNDPTGSPGDTAGYDDGQQPSEMTFRNGDVINLPDGTTIRVLGLDNMTGEYAVYETLNGSDHEEALMMSGEHLSSLVNDLPEGSLTRREVDVSTEADDTQPVEQIDNTVDVPVDEHNTPQSAEVSPIDFSSIQPGDVVISNKPTASGIHRLTVSAARRNQRTGKMEFTLSDISTKDGGETSHVWVTEDNIQELVSAPAGEGDVEQPVEGDQGDTNNEASSPESNEPTDDSQEQSEETTRISPEDLSRAESEWREIVMRYGAQPHREGPVANDFRNQWTEARRRLDDLRAAYDAQTFRDAGLESNIDSTPENGEAPSDISDNAEAPADNLVNGSEATAGAPSLRDRLRALIDSLDTQEGDDSNLMERVQAMINNTGEAAPDPIDPEASRIQGIVERSSEFMHEGHSEELKKMNQARDRYLELAAKEQKGHMFGIRKGGRAEGLLRSVFAPIGGNKLANFLAAPRGELKQASDDYEAALKKVDELRSGFMSQEVEAGNMTPDELRAQRAASYSDLFSKDVRRIAELQKGATDKKPLSKVLRRVGYAVAGVAGGVVAATTPVGLVGGILLAGGGAGALRAWANKRNTHAVDKSGFTYVDSVADLYDADFKNRMNSIFQLGEEVSARDVLAEHNDNVANEKAKNRNRITGPVVGSAALALLTKFGIDSFWAPGTVAPNPEVTRDENPKPALENPASENPVPSVETQEVERGSGEIRETRELLERLGFKNVSGADAENVYNATAGADGSRMDMFTNDSNYTGVLGDRRIGDPGTYTFNQDFVAEAQKQAEALGLSR